VISNPVKKNPERKIIIIKVNKYGVIPQIDVKIPPSSKDLVNITLLP
jgi:hypothetical protein